MNNKNIYKKKPEGGLIQSKEWSNFWLAEGKKIVKFEVDNKIFFGAINKLSLVGSYIYIPRLSLENFKSEIKIRNYFFEKNKETNSGWIRVDLNSKKDLDFLKKIFKNKIKKSPHDMQPRENFIIDISLSEDELFKNMKSKTRYNVKIAKKNGVKIFSTNNHLYLKQFFDLVNKTAERKNVNFHSFSHYEKMWKTLPKNNIKLYLAELNGKIIASNLVTFYNGVATYLHGGFDGEFKKFMAPFLLQWECILEAKKNGCRWYDFGGVYSNSKDSGKVGITRFKKGFSPKTEFFQTEGSYDIVFSSLKYNLYKFLQKFKNIFRH